MKTHPTSLMLAMTVLLLAAACGRKVESTTTTIAPADPRPASAPASSTFGQTPMVTTTGSPPPFENRRATVEPMTLRDGNIEVRPSLPRMNTAFRVVNEGSVSHQLRGMERPLAPGETIILQITLSDPTYEIACLIPGHNERATIKTYEPR